MASPRLHNPWAEVWAALVALVALVGVWVVVGSPVVVVDQREEIVGWEAWLAEATVGASVVARVVETEMDYTMSIPSHPMTRLHMSYLQRSTNRPNRG